MANKSELSEEFTGGCACGAVRYVWRPTMRFKLYACHCTDCHKRSGSAFTLQQTVLLQDLTVTGELVEGETANPSGARVQQFSCRKCLSRIHGINGARPGIAIVRAGTFDHSADIIPDVHLWTQSKLSWIIIPADAPSLNTQPDSPEGWSSLLMPKASS